MQIALAPGDKGSTDGVNWVIGDDLNKYYIGSCGGCGCTYSSRDWHMADQNACSYCYPEGWGAVFAYDDFDDQEIGNTTYISSN